MINNLIYVYCISNNPLMVASDVMSSGLKSLIFNDFSVLYKLVSESEYSKENFKKNFSEIQWLETNSREHIRVISETMKFGAVIPVKFGTIFNTKASLKKFITDYSDSLIENFHHVKEKEEWAVKIYCNRKVLSEQIDELSEETAELEITIMASSPGKAYLLKGKKTELVENEMDKICSEYGQKYYDKFNNLSESTNIDNLLPKEYSGREDTMILNATFLVSENKSFDFINTVSKLAKESANLGFCVEATGPWPPFNFISIKEK